MSRSKTEVSSPSTCLAVLCSPKPTSSCPSICFTSVQHISPPFVFFLPSCPHLGSVAPVLPALHCLPWGQSAPSSAPPPLLPGFPPLISGWCEWDISPVVVTGGDQKVFRREKKKIQKLFPSSPLRWLSVGSSVGRSVKCCLASSSRLPERLLWVWNRSCAKC